MDTPRPDQVRRAQPEAEAATEEDSMELMEMILGALGEWAASGGSVVVGCVWGGGLQLLVGGGISLAHSWPDSCGSLGPLFCLPMLAMPIPPPPPPPILACRPRRSGHGQQHRAPA